LGQVPSGVYRPRKPKASPLWQCLKEHFYWFLVDYPEKYEAKHGFLKPLIEEVVNKFLNCGDLKRGFARVKCPDCDKQYVLAFSCRGRWFCPSCHQKKVLLFGEFISAEVAFPVPHRQYVLTVPIRLRVYFRNNRKLLKKLCQAAHDSLLDFMRQSLRLPEGMPGMVMAIQTFGDYVNFHPHLHALVADGLFTDTGLFYVMPEQSLRPLEEMFRARVLALVVKEGLLDPEAAENMLAWRHSGFHVHNGHRIARDDKAGVERIAQYIIRNPFSEEKMTYSAESAQVIYRSKPNPKTRRNFEVFTAGEFIAAITQHIPDKGFQMVRYYGWYSNKSRGVRKKKAAGQAGPPADDVAILDVSDHGRRKIPSKKWRELIKKVWEVDPLKCPNCGGEMKMVNLTDDPRDIRALIEDWGLHEFVRDPPARPPPGHATRRVTGWADDIVFDDGPFISEDQDAA